MQPGTCMCSSVNVCGGVRATWLCVFLCGCAIGALLDAAVTGVTSVARKCRHALHIVGCVTMSVDDIWVACSMPVRLELPPKL